MPRGKHLSPEQIAEIVGLYEIGVTGPEIARKTGVMWSTVVKVIVRELGLVGSPDRPVRRPPPNKYSFTDEQRAELVELYRGGQSLEQLARHFHADADKLKEELGVAGEPIRPPGRPRVVAPEANCPVCGESIPAKKFFYSGEMAEKRKKQAVDWMAFLLDEGLRQWFYTSPHVREALPTLRRNVEEQKISPTAASDSLLAILHPKNGT